MPCTVPCSDCNAPCATAAGLGITTDIEDSLDQADELGGRSRNLASKLSNTDLVSDETKLSVAVSASTAGRWRRLRSARWFNHAEPGQRALYLERHLNWGMTAEELASGRPIIGIAQSGSNLSPCNRHHLELVKRVRDGIVAAGGIALEFPTHPIQESTRRPTAALDRNLAYMALVEVLCGHPLDGVVLLTGCDKVTPFMLLAAATVDFPSICLNVRPMLNGWTRGSRVGSGSVVWKAREELAAGRIGDTQMLDMVAAGTPSAGHCNTMGTASTLNALAEALGMALPGSAAIPAPYRQRGHAAYETGRRIVDMVAENLRPSRIMTCEAFENAIVANTAIGGSTSAPVHMIAIAKHLGVPLDLDDWERLSYDVPLLLNMQPAGTMLGEDYFHAGGLPAILAELLEAGRVPHPDAMTVNGKTVRQNVAGRTTWDRRTIMPFGAPLKGQAGFLNLKGNLFDSAIMKTSAISAAFRQDFLEDPADPNAFQCRVTVFDGPEDYHARVELADTGIGRRTMLVMRGVGPQGYPGAAEVVNMRAPGQLLRKADEDGLKGFVLPCLSDRRQSSTSGSPSILHASPEAAAGGNLALLRDGDVVRVDLNKRRVDLLVPEEEMRARRHELDERGGYSIRGGRVPESETPWQYIYRREVGPLSEGNVLTRAVRFQRVTETTEVPRENH